MIRRSRGWSLIEVMVYGAGLAVMLATLGAAALSAVRAHHQQQGLLEATGRAGGALRLLRSAAAEASTAAVVAPGALQLTRTDGTRVVWRITGGTLQETPAGGRPRIWVTRLRSLQVQQRADGLLRVAVAADVRAAAAPVAAESLLRVGGRWGRR